MVMENKMHLSSLWVNGIKCRRDGYNTFVAKSVVSASSTPNHQPALEERFDDIKSHKGLLKGWKARKKDSSTLYFRYFSIFPRK